MKPITQETTWYTEYERLGGDHNKDIFEENIKTILYPIFIYDDDVFGNSDECFANRFPTTNQLKTKYRPVDGN